MAWLKAAVWGRFGEVCVIMGLLAYAVGAFPILSGLLN